MPAGNSLTTATLLYLTPNAQTLQDTVTQTANDYYRFNVSYRSSFNLALTGLTGDANVVLLDRAGNPLSPALNSSNAGNFSESINTILEAGTYYVRILPSAATSSETAYSLSVSIDNTLKPDILWRHYGSGENGVWSLNRETFLGSAAIQPTPIDPSWTLVAAADFNQDGQSDILWRNRVSGENAVWLMNGSTQIAGIYLPTVADQNWTMIAAADFNGDGQNDILWRNSAVGANVVWYMNGTTYEDGNFGTLNSVGDPNWVLHDAADFNRDGKPDLLWRNYATGDNAVWILDGVNQVSGDIILSFSDLSWFIQGTGDFNQDRQTDILWRNYRTGENLIWFMDGITYNSAAAISLTVPDLNWQARSPFTRAEAPPAIDVAANTFSTAFNIGSGLVGSGTYRDVVGVTDAEDYYQFNLNVASSLDLSLTELAANLDVQLLNSNGTLIQSGTQSGSTPESIRRNLEAGTYYVRVFAAEGNSSYRLSLRLNNSPVLVTNAPLSLNEGNSANLTRDLLRVTDADNLAEQLVYTVNSLPTTGSLLLDGASLGVGGTFSQVDLDDGRRLVYQQNGSEALTDSFRFTVSDGSSVLSGNTFTIQVTGVNDPPVLTAPIARSVDQNVNSAISGITVTDADVGSATVSVTLNAVNGVLSLSSATLPDLRFSQGDGQDDRSMLFSGTLSTVNAALQTLIYRSDAAFQGTDTISILVDDNGNTGLGGRLTDNKSVTV
ncbi:FG-GAP repeat protein, partial [Leptolyngbya sp. FACHB-36]|uniref:FG-GAP-like repeat-containing protein n=1 Tax=Leptolyngbya sp. FACHB-36 TaxID=2692808 RepID=UPI001680E3C6